MLSCQKTEKGRRRTQRQKTFSEFFSCKSSKTLGAHLSKNKFGQLTEKAGGQQNQAI